jgi:hypothetical protein
VFSSRYRDMSAEWAALTYWPLQFGPAAFSQTLALKP